MRASRRVHKYNWAILATYTRHYHASFMSIHGQPQQILTENRETINEIGSGRQRPDQHALRRCARYLGADLSERGVAQKNHFVLCRDLLSVRKIDYRAKTVIFVVPEHPPKEFSGSFTTADGDIIVEWKRVTKPKLNLNL